MSRTAEDDLEAGFREVSGDEPVEKREPVEEPQEEQEPQEPEPQASEEEQEPSPEGEPSEPEDPIVPGLGMPASQVKQYLESVGQMRSEFDGALRKAYGKIGELNSTIQKLSKGGGPGRVNEAALKRLKDEYGDDLAEIIPQIFLPSQEEPAGSEKASGFDPDTLRQEFDQRLQQQLTDTTYKVGATLIASFHPDWQKQAASPEFAEWRKTQPLEVQQQMSESRDPSFVVQQLTAFKGWMKTRQANAANRNRRLEAAVTPDGIETASGREPSANEAFLAGFREEAGR